ncbi:thioesterase domain-containing protein [Coleofasciculus sp.]|uniref:thioesterase domain-containing protein n=1 Tax=Coleofasciculus sp. TaxID=3100458 RepID=UPI0039F79641
MTAYSPPWQTLVAIQPNGVKQPFFGVHTNDGSVLFYRHLIPHLNPEQPFYGLQAPVQDGKQIPFTQIENTAAHYIKEIKTLQPSGPYLLGGFCIGGVIAFEMAQQLVAQGEQVALLALFDSFAPFPLSLRSRISLHFGYFLRLEPQEKLTYLLTRLGRRMKRLAKTIQKFYPSINSQKASPYTPQVYPGRVTLFRASKQLPITYHLPDLGWGKLAREGVEVHNIPGAHTDIVLKEPSVSILAEELQACIDKATTENKSESHSLEPKNSTTKISRQASLLKQEEWSPSWSSLVPIQPSGSKPPLFWCHAGGGGVLHYRELAHHFGWEQPVYGLQAQGLDGKQTPLTRIEDMVAHYIKEIQTLQPSGPYFLGGFCFGGILAFEMAQQLIAQGQPVALLALIETPCRQLQSPPIGLRIKLHLKNFIDSEPRQKLSYIQQQVKGKSKWLGNRFKKWKNRTWLRSISTFYRSWGHSLPYNLRTEVLEEANKQAMKGYIPQVYPGKITLFLSEKVASNLSHKSRLGWDSLAAGGLEIHQVPGQHSTIGAESMVQEPHVRTLAEKLKTCIDKAIAEVVQEQTDLGS